MVNELLMKQLFGQITTTEPCSPSLESWLIRGIINHPKMAELFRSANYYNYNLPRFIDKIRLKRLFLNGIPSMNIWRFPESWGYP